MPPPRVEVADVLEPPRWDLRSVLGVVVDVLAVAALGVGLAAFGAIMAAMGMLWLADTFLVGS